MEFLIVSMVLIILIVVGILFFNGKGGFLLSGYNMLSKEEKAKYDEKSMLRFMSYIIFISAGLVALSVVGAHLMMDWLSILSTVIIVIVVVFACIYSNTGNRFKKK